MTSDRRSQHPQHASWWRVLPALLCALMSVQARAWPWPTSLQEMEQKVQQQYPALPHLSVDAAKALLSSGQPVLLLDVREPQEYAVSHLPGAVRVAPDASADVVLGLLSPLPRNSQVLMYCSVGARSSRLADRVGATLIRHGAAQVSNLRGGIFAWSGAGAPLQNAQGPTREVHGYNRAWSRLLPAQDSSSGNRQR